jgi:hypothetical protein
LAVSLIFSEGPKRIGTINFFCATLKETVTADSLHGAALSFGGRPYEVRVRVAGRTENLAEAVRIGNEVETLYTNGPAGGGGAFKSAREIVAVVSVLLPEVFTAPSIQIFEA